MDIIQRIMDFLADLRKDVDRRIKDVESWSGAASNYESTDAYCAACLIDVNSAAGRDSKAQSHCMLPVREQGDSADTYVRQAVHAAAGGHGITQVQRPDDVPQAQWDAAVKAAANKIITAYNQMDEVAPDAVYELAGKTPPERAISIGQMAEQAMGLIDEAMPNAWPWITDVYVENETIFAIVAAGGKLYRVPMIANGTAVSLGEIQEVEISFPPAQRSVFTITRQQDGKARWFAIAAASVLNRVGEIDSTKLFDSFIAYVGEHPDKYPQLDFYHTDMLMGEADWLAREKNLYLASGTGSGALFDALVDAAEKGRGVWGCSITFLPTAEAAMVEVAPGITVPVYEEGINRRIAVCLEEDAASWCTSIGEVKRMRPELIEKLKLIFGDDAKAEAFIATVDERNRTIEEQGLITRQTPEPPPVTAPNNVLSTVNRLAEIEQRIATVESRPEPQPVDLGPLVVQLADLGQKLATATSTITDMGRRLQTLEAAEAERTRVRHEDMPRRSATLNVEGMYRPRVEHADDSTINLAAEAEKTLSGMKGR